MAVIDPPGFLQGDSHPARVLRSMIAEMYDEGVMSLADLIVGPRVSGGANYSIDVAAGKAVIAGDNAPGLQGSYLVQNDAVVNLVPTSVPTAGNTRIDLLVLEVRDNAEDAGGANDARLRIIAGTPTTGTPAVPATPNNAVALARISIASTTTTITAANLTDVRLLAGKRDTPGKVEIHAGLAVPNGWLPCDGSAISRTTYARLFAHIGTSYGAGNGTTTFNLPNLVGRIPWPRYASEAGQDTLGEAGGEVRHTLTIAEMPAHAHFGATGTESVLHYHNVDPAVSNVQGPGGTAEVGANVSPGAGTGRATTYGAGGSAMYVDIPGTNTGTENTLHTHPITADGGGAAHNVMPPYTVLAPYIIRT